MNELDLINKMQQKLAGFDHIGSIQPTEEWRRSLLSRLSAGEKSKGHSGTAGLLIALVFLGLMNLGLIFNSIEKNSTHVNNYTSDLQIISNQLLMNPISLK